MNNFFNPQPKTYSQPKLKKGLKQKLKEPSGELVLFKQIFQDCKGKSMITGKELEFHPNNFAHILSKGAYPRFRLLKKNIIFCEYEIHDLYDNSSREHLLSVYPKAKLFYELKDELRTEYYKSESTI